MVINKLRIEATIYQLIVQVDGQIKKNISSLEKTKNRWESKTLEDLDGRYGGVISRIIKIDTVS